MKLLDRPLLLCLALALPIGCESPDEPADLAVEAAPKVAGACTPLTAAPGELLWDIDLGTSVSSPPAIEGDMAWFGSINGDTMFYAVRDDGTVMASADIKYGVEQSAMLNADASTVYVNTINMDGESTISGFLTDGTTPATRGRGTQALDTETLALVALNGGGDYAGRDSSPGLNAAGTAVYAASIARGPTEVALYSLNATTLTENWAYATPGWSYSSPAMDSRGNIYIGSEVTGSTQIIQGRLQGRLTSLTKNGVARWTTDATCEATGGPLVYVRGGKTGVISLDRCGVLRKLNATTGAVGWTVDLANFTLGPPVLGANNSVVYVPIGPNIPNSTAPYDEGLVAIDERSGVVLWSHAFENQDSPAVVGDNAIYAVSKDGVVLALDTDGNELWSYATGQSMHRGLAGLNECGMLQFGTEGTDAEPGGHYMAFATESTGMDTTSDCPTYRCDYHRTGKAF